MKGNPAAHNSFNDTDRSTPISSDRRRVLGCIAASCAGLADTAIVSGNPLLSPPTAAQARLIICKRRAGEAKLWPRTKRRWLRPVAERSEDSSETAFISSRVFPTAHPLHKPLHATNETGALERTSQCASSTVESAPARIPLTSTPTERISRMQMKMHSYFIVVRLPQYPVRTACALTFGHPRSMVPINAQ